MTAAELMKQKLEERKRAHLAPVYLKKASYGECQSPLKCGQMRKRDGECRDCARGCG